LNWKCIFLISYVLVLLQAWERAYWSCQSTPSWWWWWRIWVGLLRLTFVSSLCCVCYIICLRLYYWHFWLWIWCYEFNHLEIEMFYFNVKPHFIAILLAATCINLF
jgi:hypothetical protein